MALCPTLWLYNFKLREGSFRLKLYWAGETEIVSVIELLHVIGIMQSNLAAGFSHTTHWPFVSCTALHRGGVPVIMLYYVSAIHTSTHYHMTHIDVTVNKRTAGQDQSKYK